MMTIMMVMMISLIDWRMYVRMYVCMYVCTNKVVKLEERYGFGGAVQYGCSHFTKTPFVLVIQHDRIFNTG